MNPNNVELKIEAKSLSDRADVANMTLAQRDEFYRKKLAEQLARGKAEHQESGRSNLYNLDPEKMAKDFERAGQPKKGATD